MNTGSEEDEEFSSIPFSPVRKVSGGNSFNNGSLNNSDNNLSQKEDSNTSDQDLILENAIRTIDLNRDIYAIESRPGMRDLKEIYFSYFYLKRLLILFSLFVVVFY